LQIRVTCSVKIRTYARQNEYYPHLLAVDFAEKIFLWVLGYTTIKGAMMKLFPLSSVVGVIESNYLTLEPEPVYADFYDAQEVHERKPVGLKIDQSFSLPTLILRTECGNLPAAIE